MFLNSVAWQLVQLTKIVLNTFIKSSLIFWMLNESSVWWYRTEQKGLHNFSSSCVKPNKQNKWNTQEYLATYK